MNPRLASLRRKGEEIELRLAEALDRVGQGRLNAVAYGFGRWPIDRARPAIANSAGQLGRGQLGRVGAEEPLDHLIVGRAAGLEALEQLRCLRETVTVVAATYGSD